MATIQRFEQLDVWRLAHEWVKGVYLVTRAFPADERSGLTSQLRRAAVSVPANIVEGFKKLGQRDKARFYNIAEASLEEARYYLLLADELGFGSTEALRSDAERIGRMITGLIRSVTQRIGE